MAGNDVSLQSAKQPHHTSSAWAVQWCPCKMVRRPWDAQLLQRHRRRQRPQQLHGQRAVALWASQHDGFVWARFRGAGGAAELDDDVVAWLEGVDGREDGG